MSEEKYISGIHNYCDRWCERCAFAARCRVFATESESSGNGTDSSDLMDQLRNTFENTLEMLQDLMEKLEEAAEEALDDQEGMESEENTPIEEPDFHNAWYTHYARAVDHFFRSNESFFRGQELKLEELVEMGMPVDVEKLGFLHEALHTIRWYQHFIGAKVNRAISDLQFGEDIDLQGDGNGSAKVAMIAIRKSMDAWAFLSSFFADKTTDIQEVLQVLSGTRKKLVAAYPNWEQFHRPGFDDEPGTVVRLDFNLN
jgi:hypothetical protein